MTYQGKDPVLVGDKPHNASLSVLSPCDSQNLRSAKNMRMKSIRKKRGNTECDFITEFIEVPSRNLLRFTANYTELTLPTPAVLCSALCSDWK